MRKKIATVALAASLLAAVPVAPARADDGCTPVAPGLGCLVRCVALWTKDYVFGGLVHPGYTCADL